MKRSMPKERRLCALNVVLNASQYAGPEIAMLEVRRRFAAAGAHCAESHNPELLPL
jgi:hypothetical protein